MGYQVAILDFGSQTTQLIARRVRELHVYCEVFPCSVSLETLRAFNPQAIILSGGPASVHENESPKLDPAILNMGLPILGICYGMQLLVQHLGGSVVPHSHQEFGRSLLEHNGTSTLFNGVALTTEVWMSHGDQVAHMPDSLMTIAFTASCPHAAVIHRQLPIWGVQFHPEVTHSQEGTKVLANFLFNIAKLKPTFQMANFLHDKVQQIATQVKDGRVIMGLSGGVDSSVAAVLIHRAIGDRLTCVYVDHGLHRQGELEEIEHLFGEVYKIDLRIVPASELFLNALAGVTDPEAKRKTIGRLFIEVFEQEARSLDDVRFLGQGTLYPDVIESTSFHGGPSAVIKSHHNVGGLPENMKLQLVEPLRELFKDEVRELGKALGLPKPLLERQPFPGPGLAIRMIGEVTKERLALLRQADAIVREEIQAAMSAGTLSVHLWQWFAVLLPVKTIGVMGDGRTYGDTIAVRCVESTDAMTADFAPVPMPILGKISNRIINEVRGISRVVYDISSKPPSTIEWE